MVLFFFLDLGIVILLATMFVLVEMTDTVRIPPWQFERKLNDAITEELNKKLANKVIIRSSKKLILNASSNH